MMDPITFLGQPNATSSLGTKPTTLYAEPKPGQHEGAQFMYEKNTDKIVATATVFLNSPMLREKLQTGFAPIPQECSCYWLNATQLAYDIPSLTSGLYYLSFEASTYNIRSGSFAFDIPTPPQIIDDTIEPNPKPNHRANLVVDSSHKPTSNTRLHLPLTPLLTLLTFWLLTN
ncbi:hypothetical protein DSO57_1018498 [Entomophthora muscae]|uniref:Uncharacterized protein n=1 Tax=Entomophthora muscae TaxID=34485 RepID=A0ACC2TSS9_9FUNG|nr:hypothetical protein DSO57_1018498 [Entomophthora muscae]